MFDKIMYGGDYNPEQWPEEIWDEDMALLKGVHANTITLPVFAWAKLQPTEYTYDFSWLTKIIDKASLEGIDVCLATSTAVQPAWMSKKYPEMLPVDDKGNKRRFGGRVKFCPNNDTYKYYAAKLVRKMAETFKDQNNIKLWHIGNEYDNYCYCDTCRDKFREWVAMKYGTIEEVNRVWYMQFWGHQLYDFDEIEIPDFRTENWHQGHLERTNFQTILLDYKRFMNESILDCYMNELDVIMAMTPYIPVTTNFMGFFKPIDYFKWAGHLDVISWDHYPAKGDKPFKAAMAHDLMRSLKKNKPFLLMEQSPSQQNWAPYNTLKAPGVLRLQSYQTLAHGADAILYFQIRRNLGNCEKFHGAIIDHVGHGNTRVYKECQQVGNELMRLKEAVIGSRYPAEVGILFDWENWWAVEMSSGPSIDLRYMDAIERYYEGVYDLGYQVDFVPFDGPFEDYKVLIAPLLYMIKPGMKEKLETFVKGGGTLVLTTFSGLVSENDIVTTKGYPGELRELAGIWVEEIDALLPDECNPVKPTELGKQLGLDYKTYDGSLLCDIIHLEGAETIADYTDNFYKNTPAVTRNTYGDGQVLYIGTLPEKAFINHLCASIVSVTNPKEQVLCEACVEVTVRRKEGNAVYFIMNHDDNETTIDIRLDGIDVLTGKGIRGKQIIEGKGIVVVQVS